MNKPPVDSPRVLAPPPLIFVACLAAGYGLHRLFPMPLPAAETLRAAGCLLSAIALLLVFWAIRRMWKAGTNIRPDRPAIALVADGPYRFTRNPMYLALSLLHAGIALIIGGLLPLLATAVLILLLHFGVIAREEKYLETKFGSAYSTYRRRVRRWL